MGTSYGRLDREDVAQHFERNKIAYGIVLGVVTLCVAALAVAGFVIAMQNTDDDVGSIVPEVRYYVFLENTTWTIPTGATVLEIVAIGGGGGGSGGSGGGGGGSSGATRLVGDVNITGSGGGGGSSGCPGVPGISGQLITRTYGVSSLDCEALTLVIGKGGTGGSGTAGGAGGASGFAGSSGGTFASVSGGVSKLDNIKKTTVRCGDEWLTIALNGGSFSTPGGIGGNAGVENVGTTPGAGGNSNRRICTVISAQDYRIVYGFAPAHNTGDGGEGGSSHNATAAGGNAIGPLTISGAVQQDFATVIEIVQPIAGVDGPDGTLGAEYVRGGAGANRTFIPQAMYFNHPVVRHVVSLGANTANGVVLPASVGAGGNGAYGGAGGAGGSIQSGLVNSSLWGTRSPGEAGEAGGDGEDGNDGAVVVIVTF